MKKPVRALLSLCATAALVFNIADAFALMGYIDPSAQPGEKGTQHKHNLPAGTTFCKPKAGTHPEKPGVTKEELEAAKGKEIKLDKNGHYKSGNKDHGIEITVTPDDPNIPGEQGTCTVVITGSDAGDGLIWTAP